MNRLAAWLGARYAPCVVIAIGLVLAAPALTADFTADDHMHRLMSREHTGVPGLRSQPLDLFVFASGDAGDIAQLRDAGVFPWWVDPELKLAFWRPLTSATHAFDHALWPENATAQLAHNLAWHLLALVLVWLVFRRFLARRWTAVLALALFAFDDARGPVVGWIANRNALVALAVAIPVLLAHDRWRRGHWSPGRYLAPLGFAVALGAGESALAILAYIAAHALWLDRGPGTPLRERILAVAPYLAVVLIWRVLYAHLGYGVAGSGVYLDPGADPGGFLGELATRLPLLLLGQLALPWSDFASIYTVLGIMSLMLAIAVATLVAIALACARLLRRDATARFFATGMLLAAVPVASTFPADRLLTFTSIGAMGLVAQLLAATFRQRELLGDGRARRGAITALALALVIIHLVLAPPSLVLRSRSMVVVARIFDRAATSVPTDPDRTVIVATTPSDALVGYLPLVRRSRGVPVPAHLSWLATASTPITFERVDDRTLRVAPEGGYLRHEVDRMMRSPRTRAFAPGDRIALPGFVVEVETVTADGRPSTVLARFATSIDDPARTWLRWHGRAYVPYTPPPVGGRETLPAIDLFGLLAD